MGFSLYQKYRPKSFDEVVGQELIVKALTNAIRLNRVVHSYIFSGPHGVGKTTIARLFAKAINCLSLNQHGKTKCHKCASCQLFETSVPVDILELDAASNNGVEEIRNIIGTASYVPAQLSKKVYILDEAHMLTTSAWTALLKTLEDCPPHCVFILATTEFHKIPLTVLSRCQLYSFRRVSNQKIQEHLETIAQKEGVQISQEGRAKIAELADGSVRDALTMLEQCLPLAMKIKKSSATTNEAPIIDLKIVQQVFYLADTATKLSLLKAVGRNDINLLSSMIDDIDARGIDAGKLVRDLLNILIDCYIYHQIDSPDRLRYISVENAKEINLTKEAIWMVIDELLNLQKNLKYNPDANFLIKLILMKIACKINQANVASTPVQFSDKIANTPFISANMMNEKPPVTSLKSTSREKMNDEQVSASKPSPSETLIKETAFKETKVKKISNEETSIKEFSVKETIVQDETANQTHTQKITSSKTLFDEKTATEPASISEQEYEDAFIAIAYDYNEALKQADNEKLASLKAKDWNEIDGPLRSLRDSEKVVISSPLGIVVNTNSETDSVFLKRCFLDHEYLVLVKKLFGRPLYVVAGTNEQLRNLTQKYTEASMKNIHPRLDFERIKKLSKAQMSNYELVEKYFGKPAQKAT